MVSKGKITMKNNSAVSKFIYHLLNGSLLNALKYKYDIYRWNKFIKDQKVIKYHFDQDIYLMLYSDSALSRIIYQGNFEQEELNFFSSYIDHGFVVLDIGANIGLHSLYAANLVGVNGKVYSFEPVKSTFNRLKENILINKFNNIQAFNVAMSDESKTSEITVSKDGFDAWNSMVGKSCQTGDNFEIETIKTLTLDSFVEKEHLQNKIDFIKIDTEGWELQVLKGGREYLKNYSPVIMFEYSEDICENFNVSLNEVYDLLTNLGYYLYKFDHMKNILKKVVREDKFGVANLIASKDIDFSL